MYVFQSNAKLSNVMTILSESPRVLVQHVTKSMFSFLNFFNTVETKICSQTDIVKYICSHDKDTKFSWDPQLNKRIEEIKLRPRFVSITTKERAIDGFLKMLDANATACAVLSDINGQLLATLCASDLKSISADNLTNILQPVMEFFQRMTGMHAPAPLVCDNKETVLDVMKKMLQNKKHECYLVDGSFRPITLVTMTSIIALCNVEARRPIY